MRSTLAAAAEAGREGEGGEGGKPATTTTTLSAPEPDLFSVRVPAGLTSLDVDTIRLAAASTARCGPAFAKALARREAADPASFGFLRPQHSLHGFFEAMVAAYRRALAPPEERLRRLRLAIDDEATVLTRALRTLEWEQQTQAAQREAEAAAEKERVAMQSIDWHDFTVVETIAFFEDEEGSPARRRCGTSWPRTSTGRSLLLLLMRKKRRKKKRQREQQRRQRRRRQRKRRSRSEPAWRR